MTGRRIDGTELLLREREARSLTLLMAVVLACFLAESVKFAIDSMTSLNTNIRIAPVAIYLAVTVAVSLALLAALRKRLWIGPIGVAVALFGAAFPAAMAFLMWQGYAADLPLGLVTKLPLSTAGLAAIAGVTLTLRPAYVVIVGAGAILTLVGAYWLALVDPTVVFARRGGETYLTPAVSTIRFVGELLFVAGATACAAFAAYLARQTVREAVALQRTTDQLSRYFSPEVASGIRRGGEAFLRPGGHEQDVVVLFSDLAGFTRTCAGLTASQALALLSEYQGRMVAEIFKAGGTLDKFIGDGIMATFGTPAPAPDAADRAVRAARGMMAALAVLNEERVARGEPPLVQRIGIHAGPAVVGNVGTSQRLEFTVIGDTVNVASRLQAACKQTGKAAMMSAAVVARLTEAVSFEPLGPVALDGQPQPTELFALAP